MLNLLISYALSSISTWICLFMFPLVVLDATNSPIYLSASYAVETLPYIIITPFAGFLGDHYNKKMVLQLGEFFAGILCLFISIMSDVLNIYGLFLLQFFVSAIVATQHPIFQSIIPKIVSDRHLTRFNSYVSSIDNTISLTAPVISGFLITFLEKKIIWLVIGLGYLASAILIRIINYDHTLNDQKVDIRYVLSSLNIGFQYLLQNNFIRNLVLLFLGVNLGTQIFYPNFLFILKNTFQVSQNHLSYCFIPTGVGAIICALLAPRLLKRFQPSSIIISIARLQGVLLILLAFCKHLVLFISIWTVISGSTTVMIVIYFTLRQKVVPANMLSRVVGISRMLAYIAIPVGALLGGYIFKMTGQYSHIAILGGVVVILSSLLFKNSTKFQIAP